MTGSFKKSGFPAIHRKQAMTRPHAPGRRDGRYASHALSYLLCFPGVRSISVLSKPPPCLSLLMPDVLVLSHHTSDAHWILCWQASRAAQSRRSESDRQVRLLRQAHPSDCFLSCGIFAHMLHASTDAHACEFWQVHLRPIELFSRLVHNSSGCLFVLSCLYACLRDQAC